MEGKIIRLIVAAALAQATIQPTLPAPNPPPIVLAGASCKSYKSCREAVEAWCAGRHPRADGDHDGIPCENVCHSKAEVDQIMATIGCKKSAAAAAATPTAVAFLAGAHRSTTGLLPICSGGDRAARKLTCIVDGDTGWEHGVKWRALDVDTPEIEHAQCDQERKLGEKARDRLRELMAGGYTIEWAHKRGHSTGSLPRYGFPMAAMQDRS